MHSATRALIVGVICVLIVPVAPAFAASENAGSIKIATIGTPTENENNEPHVPCQFRADYYGFRAGTYAVTIQGVAPTGGGLLATDTVTIATNGRGNQFQTSDTYDLTGELAGITPHPQQGYHLRLDAKKQGTPGQGSKTKVFWIDCGTTVGGTDTEVGGKRTVRKTKTTTDDARVLGNRFVSGGRLPRTGVSLPALSGAAGAFMLLGFTMVRTGRRRTVRI